MILAAGLGISMWPLGSPARAAAQTVAPPIALSDSLYLQEGDAAGALNVLRALLEPSTPTDRATLYEALWRASRASLTLAILSEPRRTHGEWYGLAEEYGRRGTELVPARPEARYWTLATQGRMALRAGALEASSLAEAVRAGAHSLLEENPEHAGAHNALGRLYLEILELPWAHRMLGRVLAGRQAMAEANWERAEHHLKRAVELDPGMVLFRVDLARLHLARGRWDAAAATLAAAEALPVRLPADTLFQREASQLRGRIP